MKRLIATLLVTTFTIATAPAAFAAGPDARNGCNPHDARGACSAPVRSDREADRRQPAKQVHRKKPQLKGHAPTQAQLKRLPKAPRGQEYRVIDNRVVRVNSETAQVVAVLGLLDALFN